MCGICGMMALDSTQRVDSALVRTMAHRMIHRGPDSEGYYSDNTVALGFRRLSIIDLETGDQPQPNEDKSIVVVFNGEIYNFLELRSLLETKGHCFRTRSDTEVIVHAYEEYGSECLTRLRGMFAFALWDSRRQTLFLARDRLGKKPLFYCSHGKAFYFASEMKALAAVPSIGRDLDFRALDQYLTYQYIPPPRTILASIRKMSPASFMTVGRDGKEPVEKSYWSLGYQPKSTASMDDAALEIRSIVSDAVKLRMVSDVPLGALLSGGIDSSITVALMSQWADRPVRTFTIGFEESGFDEMPFARELARRFGTDHHELMVTPDAVEAMPKVAYHLDEPMADPSAVPTYYVAAMAAKDVKVVLTGDGGDESFGGYRIYASVLRWMRLSRVLGFTKPFLKPIKNILPSKLRTFTEISRYSLAEHFLRQESISSRSRRTALYSPDMLGHLDSMDETERYLCDQFENDGLGDLDQMMRADIHGYLPGDLLVKMDRMSMAHSLEARSPFLDQEVVEAAARLPERFKRDGGQGKVILRRAFADLLPPDVWTRPKQGFAVPVSSWLRGPLREMVHDTLLSQGLMDLGVFSKRAAEAAIRDHEAKTQDLGHLLWALLILELWRRSIFISA